MPSPIARGPRIVRCLVVAAAWLAALPCAAQAPVPGFQTTKQYKLERLGENHWRATGQVEFERQDMKFFADEVNYFTDTHQLTATGNVVYVSKENRIAADKLDFNTDTKLGTFYNASGTARLTENVDRSMFGTQEPEAYFYGETIEKIGPDKYRIRKGGFTTCLQPTPRWEITASSVTLTLNDYAVTRNSLLKVKGVPLFYMPIFYYPIQDDDRATGFLIPTYGTSTIRGHSLSNAFFWAIDRSQDATFLHDWYSRTGQGYGGEYRYVAGQGSDGSVRTYFLRENEVTYLDSTGATRVQPARQSHEIRARMTQRLPSTLRARADVDYFSDVTVQQTYQTNLYQATNRQRSYGGNLTGAWGANSISATYLERELFFNDDISVVNGNAPRFSYSRAPRRLFGTPVYFSMGSEFNTQIRTNRATGLEDDKQGLTRIDLSPQLRLPLSRWPFLGLQAAVTWHDTYYSESYLLDADGNRERVPEWLGRQFFELRGEVVGPTFTRIFNPGTEFAERIKHIIEPNVSIQRTTLIDNFDRIVQLESYDYTFGGTTRITYGLTNRLLAKKAGTGPESSAREFVNVGVSQTYYSDERASQYDPSYGSNFSFFEPRKVSPWLISAHAVPTTSSDVGMRMEYDQFENLVRSFGMSGRFSFKEIVQATGGWSRTKTTPTQTTNYMNFGSSVHGWRGRVGGSFSFDYDFVRDQMLQRRLQASYNAQCCGIAMEFQTYNFPNADPRFAVPRDRRFNITFTLAGIGTFSNIFGVFGANDSTRVR